MRILLLIFSLLYLLSAQAQPRQLLVPGGVAIINLEPGNDSGYHFLDKPVLVTKIEGKPTALVGLPLSLKAGEHFIEKRSADQVFKKFFEIKASAILKTP